MLINSDPANLADVRHRVERLCATHGLDEKAIGEVGLCVNEAMANVIRHAYDGATDRPIEIVVECDDARVTIRIRDWGNGKDPSELPAKKKDPLKPGGLGLICLREMMDDVQFQQQPDGMLLEMTKNKSCQS